MNISYAAVLWRILNQDLSENEADCIVKSAQSDKFVKLIMDFPVSEPIIMIYQ